MNEENNNELPTDDSNDQPSLSLGNSLVTYRPITTEMQESYLDYAMSVIVARALPDVRDGLKPVHRRILYSMYGQGLRSSSKFSKSARTVGDVMAKYHPHGDTAIYDSLVRLVQDFSMRYPLIKGQGNFGSIDGDRAAAMRYTEAKMEKITDEMLGDIEKETVMFRPNYDGSIYEPVVLPSKLPNLLLNGSMGIAVGMATNIPPHNLGELVDAIIYLSENPDCTIENLMEFIKGPDFPTAGDIYNESILKEAYATGRGSIAIRGKAEIIETKGNKFQIIISEVPYQVNKANLITKLADLVRDKKIIGISDIRDESSRSTNRNFRVVIELKKDTYPKKILNQIFKLTPLQSSFGFNMIALVDGIQPKLLNLKSILELFTKHRRDVITARIRYELKVAEARAHILEGLKKALDNIDAVISIIKASKTKEIARENLVLKFNLSEKQADAILQMRLQTLAGLEQQKIEDELKVKLDFIDECKTILADEQKVIMIMKEELVDLKKRYNTPRRSRIFKQTLGKFEAKDTIPNEPMVIALTKNNYIKRLSPTTFRAQHRGGKGIIGMNTKDQDEIISIVSTMNHNDIMYFTNKGRVFQLPAYEVPQSSRIAKGQAIVNFLQLGENEIVTAMIEVAQITGKYLFMATKKGMVKKTAISNFNNVRKNGLIAIKLKENDELKWVKETTGENQIMILTKHGKCIRFNEQDARPLGRATSGVRGIRMKPDDEAVEMDVITDPENARLLVIMENGLGKSTKLKEYRCQGRGGSGVKTANITKKTGFIIGGKVVYPKTQADLICFSANGQSLRTDLKNVPSRGRATQGVIMMRLKKNDRVASISLIKLDNSDSISTDKQQLAIK